jgi:hypothetical protein
MSLEKKQIDQGKESFIFENKDSTKVWKIIHVDTSVDKIRKEKDYVLQTNSTLVDQGINIPKIHKIKLLYDKAFMLMDKVEIVNFRFSDKGTIDPDLIIKKLEILKNVPDSSWTKLWQDVFKIQQSGLDVDMYCWANNINLVEKDNQLEFEIFDTQKVNKNYDDQSTIISLDTYFKAPLDFLLYSDMLDLDKEDELLNIKNFVQEKLVSGFKAFKTK